MKTKTINESISLLMFLRGKTNKELAEVLEVNRMQASRVRNGGAKLDVSSAIKTAEWLNVSLEDLAKGYEIKPLT